ncbi:hypothetical protein O181_020685 [Austropuccinia psidii MF-1]|uniref:Uncharacterized protein n=1 Tax=Austropuccinia psidii MF-1 TaxID=1389203 RepID=A0A9Q3GWC2_9BASI|nr:hypothetical protein [Austropuccinia psidii MF-1]
MEISQMHSGKQLSKLITPPNMANSSKLPYISTLLVRNPVPHADKNTEILKLSSSIADPIRPKLSIDGASFNTWLMCIIEYTNYFDKPERDTNYQRSLISLSFIQNSVEWSLYDFIAARLVMPNARTVYQAIKKCFKKNNGCLSSTMQISFSTQSIIRIMW